MFFFDCISIDPNPKTRLMLKQAMSFVTQFRSVYSAKSEEEVLALLEIEKYDLVFLSDKLGIKAISNFIKKAKKTEFGETAGFVLLCSNTEDAKSVTSTMLEGFDGMLLEPYSIESLQELSMIATEVKKRKKDEKQKAAFKFMSGDVLKCVDLMSQAKFFGCSTKRITESIEKMNKFILNYESGKAISIYLKILSEEFMNIKKPIVIVQECRYNGASRRIKNIEKKNISDKIGVQFDGMIKDIQEKLVDNKHLI